MGRRPPLPRFRRDLEITPPAKGAAVRTYIVRNPATNERFEFSEEDYFICQCLDGRSGEEEALLKAQQFLGSTVTSDYIQRLIAQLRQLNLLETAVASPAPTEGESAEQESTSGGLLDADDEDGDLGTSRAGRWPLFNPSRMFARAAAVCGRHRWFFILWALALIPGVPMAVYIWIRHTDLMVGDLAGSNALPYLASMAFSLMTVNLMRCLVSGTMCAYYGGHIQELGLRMRFDLILRFYVDRRIVKRLDRIPRMWVYASTILLRLSVLSAGVWIWYVFRTTGTTLSFWGIVLAQTGLLGLIVSFLPDRSADGFKLMLTAFRLPLDLIPRAMTVFAFTIRRQTLPTRISPGQAQKLMVYALVLFVFWILFFMKVVGTVSMGLASTFPQLFGNATEVIIFLAVSAVFIRWFLPRFMELINPGKGPASDKAAKVKQPEEGTIPAFAKGCIIAVLVLVAMLIPFPFRPGGAVTILPPRQQHLTAPVAGKVTEVLYAGGDGVYLAASTVVARMTSDFIENQVKTLEQSLQQQQAVIQQSQANYEKLLAGSRPEEIAQAQAALNTAREDAEVARREVQGAEITAAFSKRQAELLEELYRQGAYPLLDLEAARKEADVDRVNVEVARKTLDARQSALQENQAHYELVKNGPRAEDIEAARQNVEAASAERRRIEEEIRYAKSQLNNTSLTMPLEAYLVDGYLNQKVGSFLNQGETFAVMQDDRTLLVQLSLPEYDATEVKMGSRADVRLLALPTRTLPGQVVSIQPSSLATDLGQFYLIQIALKNTGLSYRPGMTGYAKIYSGWRPVGEILTRPIVRFIRVEFWSWLP
jgi:multidrug efflux pump subunit AcrA (membrane-fusion protein)